ncbi:NADP-dependent oxidoreductase [Aminobacter carboxidus]|uniref:NADP-dependent oxidoreductase n=1 Tax=Aminobacter carboxidus TaxID=376165 RepID=A0ABR9GQS3_9HYPH|nr:NADP-dependent oxidoreductase [Aminobacter carboxidus]MBE1206042.1 NADP-dependent oxidoreductase [Aminobacter carboxidus]
MKAHLLDHYKQDALRLGDIPMPETGDGDVLIEVHAAGLNVLDSKIRSGEFKAILPYKLPIALGHDVAGVVSRVGRNVRDVKPGDAVYSRVPDGRIGTLAEFIAVKAEDVALKPSNLTMIEAASIPLVGLTAWQSLVERAGIRKGQKVLIHAGSGGVGTIAIQLARHLGATVATTASAANKDLVATLGADVVIDYRKEAFEEAVSGYDVVLNSLGAETLEKSLDVLKSGGQLISISGPPDPSFARQQGFHWVLQFAIRLMSSSIRRKARARKVNYSFLFMKADGAQLRQITNLLEAGTIKPVIDRVFPFNAANEALAYIETGRAKGKVVVQLK